MTRGVFFRWIGPDFMAGLSLTFKYGGVIVGFGFITLEIIWRSKLD